MKNKAVLIKIAAAVAAAIIVAMIINSVRPETTLFDYAQTLDEGMFVCENGFLWRTVSEFDGEYLRVEKCGKAEPPKFAKHASHWEPDRMCAWEMACVVSYAFIGSDGSIWQPVWGSELGDTIELVPFAIPAEEYEDTGYLDLCGFSGRVSHAYAKCNFVRDEDDLNGTKALLAVRYKDGWHYVSSRIIEAKGQKSLHSDTWAYYVEIHFEDCIYAVTPNNSNFVIQLRIDIIDSESGELLAAKNLYAENYNGTVMAHKRYLAEGWG